MAGSRRCRGGPAMREILENPLVQNLIFLIAGLDPAIQ
jgi:hypothetical protein